MIVWCRGCNVTTLTSPGVCWTCRFVESIRRPIDVEVLYGPRYEHNTVDLKKLREERQKLYERLVWRWEELGF